MLMKIDGGGGPTAALPATPPSPTPPQPPPIVRPPDTVARVSPPGSSLFFGSLWGSVGKDVSGLGHTVASGASAVRDWGKDEWPTVTGFAHGMASVPGIVAREWSEASHLNAEIGSKIDRTLNGWGTTAASVRKAAIADIGETANGASAAATRAVSTLSKANRAPQLIESAAGHLEQNLTSMAGAAKSAVDSAFDRLPSIFRSPLGALANKAENSIAHGFDNVKGAAKQFYADNINRLPGDAEQTLRSAAHDLGDVAKQQASHAEGTLARTSRAIGTTLGEGVGALDKVPVLRDVPVLGAVLTAAGTAADIAHGVDPVDATVANVSSTVAATAVTSAVSDGLAGVLGGAALGDGAATAVGAVAATGPVGWAVAGGVIAGAAVGYGVYKAIESPEGQHIIAGAEHGIEAAASGVAHVAEKGADDVKSLAHGVGHVFSSIF